MATKKKLEQIKLLCRECHKTTNHAVLFTRTKSGETEDGDIWWRVENHLVQCKGCENVALYRHSVDSESLPDTTDEVFPDPEQGREPIKDDYLLPKQLRQIYHETLRAIDAKQLILTGIGIRAVVETVCAERDAKGANLAEKIDDLAKQGVLTPEGARLLHKLRVIGNKAAHEVKPHDPRELSLAMDVINHLVLGVYVLPKHADETFK